MLFGCTVQWSKWGQTERGRRWDDRIADQPDFAEAWRQRCARMVAAVGWWQRAPAWIGDSRRSAARIDSGGTPAEQIDGRRECWPGRSPAGGGRRIGSRWGGGGGGGKPANPNGLCRSDASRFTGLEFTSVFGPIQVLWAGRLLISYGSTKFLLGQSLRSTCIVAFIHSF